MSAFGSRPAPDPHKVEDLSVRFAINFQKCYGEGGYGKTFAASDKSSRDALAVKVVDTRRMKPEAILKECHILENLKHRNIIQVTGHGLGYEGKNQHLYFIFMEAATGGELFDEIIDGGPMTEQRALDCFCQLLDAITYCHIAGVAHRDLKLENVLKSQPGTSGSLKVIDFGLSHVYPRLPTGEIDRSQPLRDVCGSKSYAAPEVLAGRGYDGFQADMWSLGVCLFAMLSGFFPLDEACRSDWRFDRLLGAQRSGYSTVATIYTFYKRDWKHLSPAVIDLLDRLLQIEPTKRMGMEQAREHAWVTGKPLGPKDAYDDDGPEPVYRGYKCGDFETEELHVDPDDEPVYRSLGSALESPSMAAAALPGLVRQKGKINLQGVDDNLEDPFEALGLE